MISKKLYLFSKAKKYLLKIANYKSVRQVFQQSGNVIK